MTDGPLPQSVEESRTFAGRHEIPVAEFAPGQRDDMMREQRSAFLAAGRIPAHRQLTFLH
jgi:hypothetical protein